VPNSPAQAIYLSGSKLRIVTLDALTGTFTDRPCFEQVSLIARAMVEARLQPSTF
jgi:hypothetical protein